MDKEIAGQPLWIWLVAAGGLVLAYLYFKSHQSPSSGGSPGTGGGAGGGKYSSTSSFRETITDLHSHPAPGKKKG